MTKRAQKRGRATRRFCSALAMIGWVAGSAACATAPVRPLGFPADHTVNVVFTGGCPQRAIAQGNVCAGRPACLRVKYGEQVLIQATTENGQPTQDRFAVQFDPFQGAPHQGVGFVLLKVTMNASQGASKTFPYNVQSGTCPPLDPDFQVDW